MEMELELHALLDALPRRRRRRSGCESFIAALLLLILTALSRQLHASAAHRHPLLYMFFFGGTGGARAPTKANEREINTEMLEIRVRQAVQETKKEYILLFITHRHKGRAGSSFKTQPNVCTTSTSPRFGDSITNTFRTAT
jgi:hypothetical protein